MVALLEPPVAAADLKDWPRAYLLLETERLEDRLRRLPDAADHPSATQAISAIAPCLSMRWQWEDTDYHVHRNAGPLLIEVPKGSPLIQAYLDQWCAHDVGLWLRSDAGLDDLHAHLRSLTWVTLPGELLSRFRLQETSALLSVLRALSPERAGMLLGPIGQVLWRENAGPAFRWWRFENLAPSPARSGTTPWFSFAASEMDGISLGMSEYMLHWQVALTMAQDGSDPESARARVRRWINDAHALGYSRHEDLAALMDVFRHPAYAAQQQHLMQMLAETRLAPGARLRQCLDMLESLEQGTNDQS